MVMHHKCVQSGAHQFLKPKEGAVLGSQGVRV